MVIVLKLNTGQKIIIICCLKKTVLTPHQRSEHKRIKKFQEHPYSNQNILNDSINL
jgi:hypothetical protein